MLTNISRYIIFMLNIILISQLQVWFIHFIACCHWVNVDAYKIENNKIMEKSRL